MLQEFCNWHVHLIFEGDAGDMHTITIPSTPCLDLSIHNAQGFRDKGLQV